MADSVVPQESHKITNLDADDDSTVSFSMAPLSASSAAALARLRSYVCPPTVYTSMPLTRRAAVLLLLFSDRNGHLRVLLTLRSSTLSSYSGQVALPGGKADTLTETAFQTARREAEEEIGLPQQDLPEPFRVEHLCELPAQLSATEQAVRPCVAYLHTDASSTDSTGKFRAEISAESLLSRLNATEVAAVFSAPFHRFVTSKVEGKDRVSPIRYEGKWQIWNGTRWRMHSFFIPKKSTTTPSTSDENRLKPNNLAADPAADPSPAPDPNVYKVWGLTARILIDSARIAYGQDPDFEFLPEIGEEAMMQRLRRRGKLTGEREKGVKAWRRPSWSGSETDDEKGKTKL